MTGSTCRGDREEDPPATRATTTEPRWWQRVVPAIALTGIGVAVAVATLPAVADEVELSTSRQPQPFLELSLTTSAETVCSSERLRFRLQSHLEERRAVPYTVVLDPAGRAPAVRRTSGPRLDPGEVSIRTASAAAPGADAYTVTVRLDDRPEMLRVHCPGARR